MKKFIKFLCLLLIAALIAILVLKNAVKANDDILGGKTDLTIGETTTISITLPFEVTSFSGSINADEGGLSVAGGNVTISGSSITYLGPDALSSFTFTVTANNAGRYGLSVDLSNVIPADEEQPARSFSDSMTFDVQGEQPPEPQQSISISIESSTINVRDTTRISVDSKYPEDDSVTYSSSDESVAQVHDDGSVLGVGQGTATITATTGRGAYDSVTVTVNGGDTPPSTFTVSPTSISMKTTDGPVTISASGVVNTTMDYNSGVISAVRSDDTTKVLVTPVGEGHCTLTILSEHGESSATVDVTVTNGEVPPPPPEGQTPNLTVVDGKTTLSVNGDSTIINSDIPVTWRSSNNNSVVVTADSSDTSAIVISKNAGTADIIATAKEGGKPASVTIQVKKNDEQAAPTITPSSNIKIEVGKSVFVSANQSVTWSSSNPDIASVNAEGLVIGKGVGEARIIAKNKSGKTSAITVTVVAASGNGGGSSGGENPNIINPDDVNTDEPIESTSTFAISPRKTQTLNIGETLQIKVTKGTASSWKSSKPAVASVDNNGKVTANSSGIAYITAVATDGSVAQLKIRVRDENGNDPDPGSEANNDVPSTGEASTSLLLVVGALTFIIATFIFRKKTK